MDYIELNVPVTGSEQAEIVTAMLADLPFDSFAEERGVLKAYIPKEALIDCKEEADRLLTDMGLHGWTYIEIETQNWNALWESNFEPVEVDGACTIRAPFSPAPATGLDIVIMPKMSFGTGHHATTAQMIGRLLDDDISGLEVLDMGCGTSILAILARLRGAQHCTAIDVDEWCVKNSLENIALNGVDGIDVELGDASSLAGKGPFDLIIANINLGILLRDMGHYTARLKQGGMLYMSGFYTSDVPQLLAEAGRQGLTLADQRETDGWACLKLTKA